MVSAAVKFARVSLNGWRMAGVFVRARRPFAAPPQAPVGAPYGRARRHPATLNMGTWAETGEELAWVIVSDVPSTSPRHVSNSGAAVHIGGAGLRECR